MTILVRRSTSILVSLQFRALATILTYESDKRNIKQTVTLTRYVARDTCITIRVFPFETALTVA